MKNISIQIKILFSIIIILLTATTVVIFFSTERQKNELFNERTENVNKVMEILMGNIRGIMLSGEAPIAVRTMSILRDEKLGGLSEIAIYRINGDIAFNDFSTLEFVNQYQDFIKFEKTERINKTMVDNKSFKLVIENQRGEDNLLKETKEYEFFFPILNEEDCQACHGTPEESNFLRGVAHLKISIADIYEKINKARLFLLLLLGGSSLILAVLLIFLIQRIIILPIFSIGKTVQKFGSGNLDVNVGVKSNDELGVLAKEINLMFKGVKERINLSKYVSKSTDEMIKKGQIQTAGEKKHITVLFSDIRGFTSYSEKNPPEKVVENLNKILQVQADVVEKFNGDVDKFVGDEIMAVFDNEYNAIKSAYEMIYEVNQIDKKNKINLFVGIGINTGEVIAGNIGSKNRQEYAVIGDTINLASRLCNIAKPNMLLISESTYEKVKGKINAKLITGQKIKGKTGSINFYAVQSLRK